MSTSENLNKVSPLRYDLYNKILAMAEFYFGEETDYLKSGFIAWVVECMTMFMRDSAIQKTMIKNENTLNTAVMTKTIYDWAKMFGIQIPQATPASCDFVFTLDCNELDTMMGKRTGADQDSKFGSDVTNTLSGTNCVILDRKDSIQVNSYSYTMERSIIIYKNQTGSYIVKYCNTETPDTTKFDNHGENILKTVLREDPDTGNRYLSFTVKAYQYKVTSITKQVTSSAFIESENHIFEFDDQFCGVRLKYRKGNEEISVPMYFSDSNRPSNLSLYCYYDLIDDQTLRVKFKPSVFLPSVGSTLICDIYSTVGKEANTKFNSQPIMSLSDETYRSMSILVSFVDYQSSGGKNKISSSDLKQNIIRELSTRDVIVTEEDLNNYFKLLGGFFESINDGQVKFLKKRDDIIRRTFNAYVLLRDGLSIDSQSSASTNYRSQIVPTNTVDVNWTLPASYDSSSVGNALQSQYVKKTLTGSKVSYSLVTADDAASVDDANLFKIPFYTQVYLSPIRTVKYIYDMTDDSTSLSYHEITNASTLYMSPSTVSLVKDSSAMSGNEYILSFLFHTDFNLQSAWNNTPVTLKIYESNTSNSYEIPSSFMSVTSTTVDGSDVYNSIIKVRLPVETSNPFIMVQSDTDNLNYGQKVRLKVNTTSIVVNEEAKVGLVIDGVFNNQTYECEFISDEKLTWFKNLDDIMSSDMVTTVTDSKISSILIKEVPIVSARFYRDTLSVSSFINTLMTYIKLLKENKSKLETNTSFNLKFMNTYGESAAYTSTSTNLRLELSIYTGTTDTTIHNEIRHYIRHLVDLANEGQKLRVSTVLAMVTAAYNQYIDHIEFEGLNGTFDQYIEAISTSDESSIVPEYFNLDRDHIEEDIKFVVI